MNTGNIQPLPPLTPLSLPPDEAVRVIMDAVIVRYGEQIKNMQFHAWDEHQQPTGPAMSASTYAGWLLETNSQRNAQELQQLFSQYDAAFQTNHGRTDSGGSAVATEQVAEYLIAAEVFRHMASSQTPSPTPPTLPTHTQTSVAPALKPAAPATPSSQSPMPPEAPATPETLKPMPQTEAPQPQMSQPVLQPSVPTPLQPPVLAPESSQHMVGMESSQELKKMRSDVLQSLGFPAATTLVTAEQITAQKQLLMEQKQATLTQQGVSGEQLQNELRNYENSLELQSIQLQSIDARLGMAQ